MWLRKQIGLSKQTPGLFSGTLRTNIIYGSEGRLKLLGGVDKVDRHIKAVLKLANLWEHFNNADRFPQASDPRVSRAPLCVVWVKYIGLVSLW